MLDAGTAVLISGIIELVVLAVGLRQVVTVVRHYRRDRTIGLSVEAALEDGLSVLLPRKVARLVALEPRIWIYLIRWIRKQPLKSGEFSYNKRSLVGAVVALAFISGPVELLLAEILIPWPIVRWIVLIVTLYSVIWLLGFNASLRVLPHRLEADGVRVHYGLLTEGYILYTNIAEIKQERHLVTREGLTLDTAGQIAYMAVGGRTDLTLYLHEPVSLQRLVSPAPPVTTLFIAADEPGKLAHELQERMDEAQAATVGASHSVAIPAT